MGRWECIQESPKIILDVAHNEHGIKALLDQLFDIKLIDATKRNLDGDIYVQLELVKYYYDTFLQIYPINSQFIGILGGFNKSILYYEDPKLTDGNQKTASLRLRGFIFFILVDKIGRALGFNDKFSQFTLSRFFSSI